MGRKTTGPNKDSRVAERRNRRVNYKQLGYFFCGDKAMLNWQEKRWVKVVAMVVVAAFLSYDIAWAMDFSPLAVPSIAAQSLPKISTFTPESASTLTKIQEKEGPEDTEISFRSQIVPRKNYEERSGFLRLEAVKNMIQRQMEEIKKPAAICLAVKIGATRLIDNVVIV